MEQLIFQCQVETGVAGTPTCLGTECSVSVVFKDQVLFVVSLTSRVVVTLDRKSSARLRRTLLLKEMFWLSIGIP